VLQNGSISHCSHFWISDSAADRSLCAPSLPPSSLWERGEGVYWPEQKLGSNVGIALRPILIADQINRGWRVNPVELRSRSSMPRERLSCLSCKANRWSSVTASLNRYLTSERANERLMYGSIIILRCRDTCKVVSCFFFFIDPENDFKSACPLDSFMIFKCWHLRLQNAVCNQRSE